MAEQMHWPVGLTMDAMEKQPDCEVDDLRHGFSQKKEEVDENTNTVEALKNDITYMEAPIKSPKSQEHND